MPRRKEKISAGITSVRNRFKMFRWIIYGIALLFAVILIVMCVCSMDEVVEGKGTVVGIREYDLKTLVTATVSKVFCSEGDEVRIGELLVEFDSSDQQDKISRLKQELEEMQQELSVKEREMVILRKDPLPDYLRHTQIQLEEARARFAKQDYEFKVYAELFEKKVITRREFLDIELTHLESQMELRRYESDWEKIQSGIAQDILTHAEQEIELLRKRIGGKEQEIEVAVRQLEDYKLYAPDDGVVTEIPPRAGGFYERGDVVVLFSANRNKKVIAMIDERQIAKVAPAQRVRIYCQQYNYLDFGFFTGTVTGIYQLPVEENGINYYPVRIALDKEQYPLRFGSKCDVKIIAGSDKIIFVMLGLHGKNILGGNDENGTPDQ